MVEGAGGPGVYRARSASARWSVTLPRLDGAAWMSAASPDTSADGPAQSRGPVWDGPRWRENNARPPSRCITLPVGAPPRSGPWFRHV
jgi:hypothetical protein